MCEEACPKSAIYLTDRLVDVETTEVLSSMEKINWWKSMTTE
jgi:formate hydrogenlyase subunit 6/NADH:ubiquinone oxidoreductase subunit I